MNDTRLDSTLPAQHDAALGAAPEGSAAGSVPHRAVVLLVDDQLIIGEAVRRIIGQEPDIEYHFCRQGAEAVATAIRLRPTVILQDLVMPDADGLDLVLRYREHPETELVPLVVLSSREEGKTKAEAFARGANDYLVKLPDPAELLARLRYHSRGYVSLLERNAAFDALAQKEAELSGELAKAANYVRSLLPPPAEGRVSVDWRFVPSASLGGDCLDYFWLDENRFALHVLDVCGHGVGPALLGVSAMNLLRTDAAKSFDRGDPLAVLRVLNETFRMSQQGNMFFTIWYAVFDFSDRRLRYVCGGHPPPILLGPGGEQIVLEGEGLPVGVLRDAEYELHEQIIPQGAELIVYSDGAIEVMERPGETWGTEGLQALIRQSGGMRGGPLLDVVLERVRALKGGPVLDDDMSIMAARFEG
jgi:sigma-B regulation protein RsbU (phosphoserine phosphatase)